MIPSEKTLAFPPGQPQTTRHSPSATLQTIAKASGRRLSAMGVSLLCGCLFSACTHYTPKPRGYVRIEPPEATYEPFAADHLPYRFNLSQLAVVEKPAAGESAAGILLAYPTLGATLYGSYLSLPAGRLETALADCRKLVAREAALASGVTEKAYSNPEHQVYGSLFLLEGDVASPVQFMLTDSISRLFRGALYYDCRPNADSLAPLTSYLSRDVIEFIQSFNWKK